MKRFTGHGEDWGDFIDVKINAPNLIPSINDQKPSKYSGKKILLSSVTDPYIPIEGKYEITRGILQKLIPHQPDLSILTKSDLVLRDLDLIKQFKNREIGFSFSSLEEYIRMEVEPRASPIDKRLNALKMVHEKGVRSYVFISPIIPFITDWKDIINKTSNYTYYFMFENLNVVGTVWLRLKGGLNQNIQMYWKITKTSSSKTISTGKELRRKLLIYVKPRNWIVRCTSTTSSEHIS